MLHIWKEEYSGIRVVAKRCTEKMEKHGEKKRVSIPDTPLSHLRLILIKYANKTTA